MSAPFPGIVFLFGAGASVAVGSGGCVSPEPPPLMAALFDRLARDFPREWASSPLKQHAAKFRSDFETAFADVVLHCNLGLSDPPTLNLLELLWTVSSHFARYRLETRGEDLYSALLRDLRNRNAVELSTFGSLNYDTLLEQAAAQMGYGIDWLVDEATSRLQSTETELSRRPNAIRVAKLHGSSNFVTRRDSAFRAMAASSGVAIETEITTVSPTELVLPEVAQRLFDRDDCWPVISQLSSDKTQLLAPSQMLQIRSIWSRAITSAASVIIIGVSPREHDEHVWAPIQATRASMFYIGAEAEFATWSSLSPERWRHIADKWETAGQVLEYLR
jgi:hypothetical protein